VQRWGLGCTCSPEGRIRPSKICALRRGIKWRSQLGWLPCATKMSRDWRRLSSDQHCRMMKKGRRRSQTPTRQPAVSPHVLLLATVDGGSLAPACSSRRSLPAARAFFALRSPSPARDCSALSSPSPAGGLGQRPLLARHEVVVAGRSPGC
jgi:hypothetical protein